MIWPRHRLDLRPRELFRGGVAGARAGGPERVAGPGWLACLSVRSAFDLLLSSMPGPPGDDVLMSAVTHPDMARIARHHGLRVVPLPVERATLAADPGAAARLAGPRTRAIVAAQLFGARPPLAPLRAVADRCGALLVEDCAQGFAGAPDAGDPAAGVALFSFGMIKTQTALGGALVRVDDPALLERMRARQATWPLAARATVVRRAAVAIALDALARPRPYGALLRGLAAAGVDVDDALSRSVRGFAGPFDVVRLRRRPPAPLLALLAARPWTADRARLDRRRRIGERLMDALPPAARVGDRAARHSHWVLPVLARDPTRFAATLLAAGFDVSRRTTGIAALAGAERERALLEHVVFLPTYAELTDAAVARLAEAAAAALAGDR